MASTVCSECGNSFFFSTDVFAPAPKTGGGFFGLGKLCSVCAASKQADQRHRELMDSADRQRQDDDERREQRLRKEQQSDLSRERLDKERESQQARIRERESDYEFEREMRAIAADNAESERQNRLREALVRSATDLLSAGMAKEALLKIVDAEAISGADSNILKTKLMIAAKIGGDSLLKSTLNQVWRRIELNEENWKRPRHEISSECDMYSSYVKATTSEDANRALIEHKKWVVSWKSFDQKTKHASSEREAALQNNKYAAGREMAIRRDVDSIGAHIDKVARACIGAKELQALGRGDLAHSLLIEVHKSVLPTTSAVDQLLVDAARELNDTSLLVEFSEEKARAKVLRGRKGFSFIKLRFPEGHGANAAIYYAGIFLLPGIACLVSVWILGFFGYGGDFARFPIFLNWVPVLNVFALGFFFISVFATVGFSFGIVLLIFTVVLPVLWLLHVGNGSA